MMSVPRPGQKRGPPPSAALDEITNKRIKTRNHTGEEAPASLLKLPTPSTPVQPSPVMPMALMQTTAGPGEDSSGSACPPYGQTYRHPSTATATTLARGKIPLAHVPRCGLRIGTVAFEDAHICFPQGLGVQEKRGMVERWQRELKHQEDNPPALPPSQVAPLPPKTLLADYIEIPEGAGEEEKARIRQYNNNVASQSQQIDRERNNQAAKKSRETRLEALHNTRQMLNDKAAECAWLRLKLIQLGGDPADWDAIEARVRSRMVDKVAERVTASDQRLADDKKREEQKKRAERTKAKMMAKEMAAGKAHQSPSQQLQGAQASAAWGR